MPTPDESEAEKRSRQEHAEARRKRGKYQPPVAWLLGRQLLSSLKGTLLFTAYGSKLDARDWMRAEEFPKIDQKEAQAWWWGQAGKSPADKDGHSRPESEEFWFDYISDTGDGMKATYSVAYLCMCDLWAEDPLEKLQNQPFGPSRPGRGVGFVAKSLPKDKYPNANLNITQGSVPAETHTELPRGQFLLVGGDTTYHLSDYESLHTRFQKPFSWAHADVKNDGRLLKETRRPLFGIPGNHDYYDQLDGFRRQFHDPVKPDEWLKDGEEGELGSPQLAIPGFFRRQRASYISLRLPFGWLLWGLDTEVGKIDERQRKFFRTIKVNRDTGGASPVSPAVEAAAKLDPPTVKGEVKPDPLTVEGGAKPDKLIVATSAPTTVFGKYADKDDEKSAKAFYQLGLPRPFLDPKDQKYERELKDDQGQPSPDWRENELEAGQCRLDLSGDVHLYARYWGRASGPDPRGPDPRGHGVGDTHPEHKEHYASVVSGLGGAFHHPSMTDAGEVCEQVLYPPQDESRRAVADEIFKLERIIRGGGVWAIGLFLAFLIYFAATYPHSSGQTIANLPLLPQLGITTPRPITPTAPHGPQPDEVDRLLPWSALAGEKLTNPAGRPTPPARPTPSAEPTPCDRAKLCDQQNQYRYFWGAAAFAAPRDYLAGVFLTLASLGLIGLALLFAKRFYKKYRKQEEVGKDAIPAATEEDDCGGAGADAPQPHTARPDATQSGAPRRAGGLMSESRELFNVACGKYEGTDEQSEAWYKKLMRQFSIWVGGLVLLSALALALALLALAPYKDFITPFGISLLVLSTLVWAGVAAYLGVGYTDWLTAMASKITIRARHWILVWLLSGVAVLGVVCTFAVFGHYNTASDMYIDILLTVVAAAVFFGLTIGGAVKFGEVKSGATRRRRRVLGGVLGLFHAVLQLCVPFLLVRKGTWLAWLAALALLAIMRYGGARLLRGSSYKRLPWAWAAAGALMLAIPYLAFYFSWPPSGPRDASWKGFIEAFRAYDGSAMFFGGGASTWWELLIVCAIAGLVGLVSSCVWLGWYFATALAFDGHNNEAGGAARIERYKQFIRFRLTETDLTGFVVAVDDPQEDGNRLRPRLVDVIYLTLKK